jgi:hypothetical protein
MNRANMKISHVVSALSLCVIPSVASGQTAAPSVEKILSDAATELSRELPKQMDRSTRAIAVAAQGKVMTFSYLLNVPQSVLINPSLLEAVKAQSIRHNCSNQIIARLMMVGATMRRTYSVEGSDRTFSIDVNWPDCPK